MKIVEEEDLEWISNEDAFPLFETFVEALPSDQRLRLMSSENVAAFQFSPITVLETRSCSSTSLTSTTTTTTTNSSGSCDGSEAATAGGSTAIMSCSGGLNVPVKARSKRRHPTRVDLPSVSTHHVETPPRKKRALDASGRKCTHCGSEKTPQWRGGPAGPNTLCNACGVRFKSGRLVPEYRPANSPTFSPGLHSNSHRKVMKLMMQRQQVGKSSSPATRKTVNKG
ncbi:PREDICTED: GATA transcription factor 1 isoform X2 [Tarenaya hassleriana]|uniref:GATA transcription factor 1 isoform X2 n=1 Tax=Tarenaya hassleriana TaxID=28532 RepID=UPI00053C23FF|nr:PREDICTED: GATA transcription factor 1 isoform X2 [Tarenaya hassleriana]